MKNKNLNKQNFLILIQMIINFPNNFINKIINQ